MNNPKIINTSKRSRIVKPTRAMGDQPPTTGTPLIATVDRDKAPATSLKSKAAKANRTMGSSEL